MEENQIRKILKSYRHIESDIMALRVLCTNKATLEKKILQKHIIDSWLRSLNDFERWVVEIHLISGLIWPLVAIRFENKWGKEQARDERTLKRIQSKAIEKIKNNINLYNENNNLLDLFDDIL